jgi:hypothetical protein
MSETQLPEEPELETTDEEPIIGTEQDHVVEAEGLIQEGAQAGAENSGMAGAEESDSAIEAQGAATEASELDAPIDHEAEFDPDDPCRTARQELESIQTSVESASLGLAKSQLNVRKLGRKVNHLEVELSEMESDLQEIQNAQQSLEEWIRARRGSFAWRLSDSLAHERSKASAERARSEAAIVGGRERALRLLLTPDKKHRLWPRLGAQLGILIALVVIFQYLRNFSPWPWTSFIPTPWPMIGFASLLFVGIGLGSWLNYERSYASSVLLERWQQRKDDGVQGLDSGQHALALIDFTRAILVPIPLLIALGFAIMFVRDLLPTPALAFFPQTWILWAALGGIYIILFFTAWMNYYRFISQFRRQLREVLYESNRQKRTFLHASTEEMRLGAMHSLVPDYLEMLGGSINSPWEVDLSQVRISETRPDGTLLPASVGLAEATGGDSRQWHLMELKSRSLLYRPGWITQAFRNILERIADFEGINPRLLTPDTLAADPGDSRRGQRRLVAEASARPEVLSSTGQVQLRALSESIQRGVIREIKPLVEPLREDELEELDIATSRFKPDNPGQVPWDLFLKEALSDAAPFSMLTFSDVGISRQSFMVHESHALVPGDLIEEDEQKRGQLRIIKADESSHSTPLDIVIRIDHSDWLDPTLLTLFSDVELPEASSEDDAESHWESRQVPSETVSYPDE